MKNLETTISAEELGKQLQKRGHLIDVRERVEHAEEHIAGAKLIPLAELGERFREIGENNPVIVMCQSGRRGEKAVEILAELGHPGARNLEGGILGWKAAGMPVVKGGRKGLPLMQQVQLTIGIGVLTGALLALTVGPHWVFLCAFFGAGLIFAGSTGWCGLAILMSKMPWNRVAGQSCGSGGNCSTTH